MLQQSSVSHSTPHHPLCPLHPLQPHFDRGFPLFSTFATSSADLPLHFVMVYCFHTHELFATSSADLPLHFGMVYCFHTHELFATSSADLPLHFGMVYCFHTHELFADLLRTSLYTLAWCIASTHTNYSQPLLRTSLYTLAWCIASTHTIYSQIVSNALHLHINDNDVNPSHSLEAQHQLCFSAVQRHGFHRSENHSRLGSRRL
jgi:hypothetical protein